MAIDDKISKHSTLRKTIMTLSYGLVFAAGVYFSDLKEKSFKQDFEYEYIVNVYNRKVIVEKDSVVQDKEYPSIRGATILGMEEILLDDPLNFDGSALEHYGDYQWGKSCKFPIRFFIQKKWSLYDKE